MNRSFENIFEKHNITCNIPGKRNKKSKTSTQLFTFPKNEQKFSQNRSALLQKNECSSENVSANLKTINSELNTTTNLNSNTSYYLNNSAKKKYFCSTRYKTLEVTRFENISEQLYSSNTESPTSRYRCPLSQRNECSTENVLANLKTSNSELNTTTNLNSSYYLNNSAKKKYFSATRYKTLEIVRFENISEQPYTSNTESFTSNENINNSAGECCRKANSVPKTIENEGNNLTRSEFSSEILGCDNTEFSNNLRSGFRNMKYLHGYRNRVQTHCLRYNRLNISFKEKKKKDFVKEQPNCKCETSDAAEKFDNDIFQSFESSSQQPSQIIDTPTLTQQSVDNVSTELDLLIDLIEYENRISARRETHKRKHNSNCNDILPKSKSRLKGGYEEMFERALKRETVRRNFLKHDRKIGLRTGKLLTVLKMDTFYGLTIATVEGEDLHKNVGLVIAQEMVPQLKLGSQIEAFFDDKILPYKLHFNGDYLEIYLQPYKLLVV